MSDKKTFDTFIFDLDGTILDTLPDLVVVTNEALREQGFPERTHDEVLSFVGNGLVALMYQAVPENTPKDVADQAVACWKRFNLEYDNHLTAPACSRNACRTASARLQAGSSLQQVRRRRAQDHRSVPSWAFRCGTWRMRGHSPKAEPRGAAAHHRGAGQHAGAHGIPGRLTERHLGRSSRRRLRHRRFVGVPQRAGNARCRIGHHARNLLRPAGIRTKSAKARQVLGQWRLNLPELSAIQNQRPP